VGILRRGVRICNTLSFLTRLALVANNQPPIRSQSRGGFKVP